MKRKLSAILIVAGMIPAVLAYAGDTAKVCFKNVCVRAEVVADDPARIKGLMFREKLGDNEGMLFVFPFDARQSFWMKNMRFALDIIWIDRDKMIVDMREDVPPCAADACRGLNPQAACRYVLEVTAGFVRRHGIKAGQRIRFTLP